MKVVRFFQKGVILAVLTIILTLILEIVLWGTCLIGMSQNDILNPFIYLIVLPAIGLSKTFSRETNLYNENLFEANSLKEAFLEGFGWAAIQFGLLSAISTISLGLIGDLALFTVYLVSLGAFIGPLTNYVFREFRNEDPKEKKSVIIAIITIILFSVVVPLSLYLYSTISNASSNTSSNTSINTIGNTSGNLANDGKAALKGEWIYYLGKDGLYKIKTDGTGKAKLSDDFATEINVVGDWIYYSNEGICKIKTDGTGKTKISSEGVGYINVIDDWIYYLDDKIILYKIKTDGTGKTKISDDEWIYFKTNLVLVGDWIYYCDGYDSEKLYKIKTDGTGKAKICDDAPTSINVQAEWIYYCYSPESSPLSAPFGELYKIKTDGKGKTKLSGDFITEINVAGDWIYYINDSDNGRLYKIKTDGTGKTKLSSDLAASINVVGGWIYYYYNYGYGAYKIKIDGTGRSRI